MKSIYVVDGYAFVRHPASRGLWVRTHVCVAKAACEVCNQPIGVPCLFKGGHGTSVHYKRKRAARELNWPKPSATHLVIDG